MLKLGELGDDVITRVVGYRASGATSLFLGNFPVARACLEEGLELYDPAQRALYGEMTSVDTHVALLGYLAQTLACCGQLDQAHSLCEEAIAEARDTSYAPTLAHILWSAWCTGWSAHSEPSTLLRYTDELLALSADRELAFWHKAGMVSRGWCLAVLGRGEQGVSLLTDGLSDLGTTIFGPLVLTMLADASRIVGQPGVGLAHLTEAERQAEATHVRWCQSEILRMRGVLLTLTGDRVAAEASFRDAITVAQQQSAKFFELRAALDLARHWHAQGKHDEARDLLAPIYGWFTEGFDTLDLKEAKALLDGLAP
jgi:predicted ATPase